jgi:diguanylate cyclase (GGDEF)-like protein
VARSARTGRPLSLAFLDLDDFTTLNEQRGRPAGDRILYALARDWAAKAGPDALISRCGADEFALLAPAGAEETTALLETFRDACPAGVSFAAGIAARIADDTPVTLTNRAEAALDEAERAGGSRIFFSQEAAADDWAELADALAAGEFTVVYQPIADLHSGTICGAEALLRWTRPGRGAVSPAEFIPVAERSGFIIQLGSFVLDQACRAAASWPRELPAKLTVNVSGRELHQPEYYEQVVATLIHAGLPADRLVLEVTESMLEADSPAALNTLQRLRALGIRIAIDDFGTGYSSLSRLNHLPADILKIDQSFVAALGPDDREAPLIGAITALAAALGLNTVAEGVEEPYQATLLTEYGCDEAQGWLHGKPGPPELIGTALQRRVEIADAVEVNALE